MNAKVIIPILLIYLAGCGHGMPPCPDYSIYKTKADYFDKYFTTINDDGVPGGVLMYRMNDGRIFNSGIDTIYILRVRLDSGYVFDGEIGINSKATDIRINYVVKLSSLGKILSRDTIANSIIDMDPFLEFYSISCEDAMTYQEEMNNIYSGEEARYQALMKKAEDINQIIRDGELADYFTKIK